MLKLIPLVYGTDPEAFLMRNGVVIGSEKVIPKDGLGGLKTVVRDGVQIEFNPGASPMLATLGASISASMRLLSQTLKAEFPDVSVCFDEMIEVERAELNSLIPENQVLGCAPSKNAYGDRPITVDGKNYRKRSAGGHLHLGMVGRTTPCVDLYDPYNYRDGVDERDNNIVPLFDIFVGNMAVLLDRDMNQVERRLHYGRAGEYRTPKHGLEYRTPSSFWLRHFCLMDLMFGMANFALSIAIDTRTGGTIEEDELLPLIDINKFIKAIDHNDFELAKSNFETLVPFMRTQLASGSFPLTPGNLDQFLTFADTVKDKGLSYFFPDDPLTHWVTGVQTPFQSFLKGLF